MPTVKFGAGPQPEVFRSIFDDALRRVDDAYAGRWPLPAPPIPPDVDASALLTAIAELASDERLGRFASAFANGSSSAVLAMPGVVAAALPGVEQCLDLCHHLLTEEDNEGLANIGESVSQLAAAAGEDLEAFAVLIPTARARFALRRMRDTVSAYDAAIGLAQSLRSQLPADTLKICHDNRGLATLRLGQPHRALEDFRIASRLADDPTSKAYIDEHRGHALLDLGEFDRAIAVMESNLRRIEAMSVDTLLHADALNNLAHAHELAGNDERALALYERRAEVLPYELVERRYTTARARARVLVRLGDQQASASAFAEAIHLAEASVRARVDRERFDAGWANAIARLVDVDGSVWKLRSEALERDRAGDLDAARELYLRVSEAASRVGDELTALECSAHVGAIEAGFGALARRAQIRLSSVRQTALTRGLAYPAVLAGAALAGLIRRGLESNDADLDALFLTVEGWGLGWLAIEQREELEPRLRSQVVFRDPGPELEELGRSASGHGAFELAIRYFDEALELARDTRDLKREVFRTANLLAALERVPSAKERTGEVASRLREFAMDAATPVEGRLAALHSLGGYLLKEDARSSLDVLREGSTLFETLRHEAAGAVGLDPSRLPELESRFPVHELLLSALIQAREPDIDAFNQLQRLRARRLMERLAWLRDPGEEFQPPDSVAVAELLGRLPVPTTLVDVTSAPWGLRAFIVDEAGVRTVDAHGSTAELTSADVGDVRRRAASILELTLTANVMRELVSHVESLLPPGRPILIAVDDPLSNLPFEAIPFDGRSWAEQRPMGRIPAIAALQFTRPRSWAGRSIVVGDSAGDLPGALDECAHVARALGAKALVRQDCTLSAVRAAMSSAGERPDLDVIHIAVHGRADARKGGRASLLFADGAATSWVEFGELAQLSWRAGLVVFSGCSTAVGGPRDGQGLFGVVQSIFEAGAPVAVASLWPVDDQSARDFMIAFHERLEAARTRANWVDLRQVLDEARRHLRSRSTPGNRTTHPTSVDDARTRRDGRDLWSAESVDETPAAAPTKMLPQSAAALEWAAFTLIGDPILRVRA
ncbi:CHAT domain-containing protein [Agromyces sp. NPDC004153]